jgi:hypothetical protein
LADPENSRLKKKDRGKFKKKLDNFFAFMVMARPYDFLERPPTYGDAGRRFGQEKGGV